MITVLPYTTEEMGALCVLSSHSIQIYLEMDQNNLVSLVTDERKHEIFLKRSPKFGVS